MNKSRVISHEQALSKPCASNEEEQVMDIFRTNRVYLVIRKSLTRSEQIMRKSWTSYE